MKTNETVVGIAHGKLSAQTKDICHSLAEKGVSCLVVQKENTPTELSETAVVTESQHWSGKPGQDLFFNGWKLLF
ncbi:hypothetical protein [Spirosoma spitsbergense]|jgi:hypothetical protein|uniref:hypothetical protein n=1 Tax=Spirosoma spitsbergense TaxID=431554 RepID=UPI0003735673|nr:hypothetical protein [Spirosoma spitsbergense]